jgi:hypothetical protein
MSSALHAVKLLHLPDKPDKPARGRFGFRHCVALAAKLSFRPDKLASDDELTALHFGELLPFFPIVLAAFADAIATLACRGRALLALRLARFSTLIRIVGGSVAGGRTQEGSC